MISKGAQGVTVRRMRPGEDRILEPMWRRGFHEMHATAYARMQTSPAFWVFVAANAAFGAWHLLAAAAPQPALLWRALVGCGACAFAAALATPPLGRRIVSFFMWRAVKNQRFLFKSAGGSAEPAYWVAEAAEGGALLGCVCVKLSHTLEREREAGAAAAPGEASVWRLTVDPAARKLGVGRALMAEAERFAQQQGCRAMSLITGNEGSRAFYAKLGYACEESARARRAVFGERGAPRTLLGRMRAAALPRRLQSTILFKKL
jgi:ribosomal protein S18 acetylase RimI-like enzyme